MMATATSPVESIPIPAKSTPPLRNGDHLDAHEFLRRYDAMPHLKKAELIDGRVYIDSPESYPAAGCDMMASPVSFEEHSASHSDLITWLGAYRATTPGVRGGDNGTVRLAPKTMPQPDAMLLILPSHGGQVRIGADRFIQGAPELVVEIAYSSVSYDLYEKLEVYRLHGVREYIAGLVEEASIAWFVNRGDHFDRLEPETNQITRSECFPALWLDSAALLSVDMVQVLQIVQQGIASPEHAAFVAWLREAA